MKGLPCRLILNLVVLGILVMTAVMTACATSFRIDRLPSLDDERQKAFQKVFASYVKMNKVVGAAAVFIKSDGDSLKAQYGSLDGGQTSFTTATKMPIGSVTKSLTALWFLRSQGKHGFSLKSSPPNIQGVSFSDLFSHSSGVQANLYAGMFDLQCAQKRLGVKELEPYFEHRSGKSFRYSNLGYEMIASAASEKMKVSFEQSMNEELMSLRLEGFRWMNCQDGAVPGFSQGKHTKLAYLRDLAAGGLVGSAEDLEAYLRLLLANRTRDGREVLSKDNWTELFKNQLAPAAASRTDLKYGLGWNLNGMGRVNRAEIIWHFGSLPPYQTAIAMIPELKTALIFVSNSQEAHNQIFPFIRHVFEVMTGGKVEIDQYRGEPIQTQEWRGLYVGIGDRLLKLSSDSEKAFTTTLLGEAVSVEEKQGRWYPFISRLWGLLKIGLGDDVYLTPALHEGQKTFVVRGMGQPLNIIQLSDPSPLPTAWISRLGDYVAEPKSIESQALFAIRKLRLKLDDERLIASLNVANPSFDNEFDLDVPLSPKSDSVAVSDEENNLLTVQGEKLIYSGFSFRKVAP